MYPQIVILSVTLSLASGRGYPPRVSLPDRASIERHCGRNAAFCHRVDGFPSHLVHAPGKRPKHVEELLQKSNYVSNVAIGNRNLGLEFGDVKNGDNELCRTKKAITEARVGLTKDDTYMFLYNNGEYAVEEETCENAGGDCRFVFPGLQMTCEQKYLISTLTAIDSLQDIVNKEFKIPAGCVCKFRKIMM